MRPEKLEGMPNVAAWLHHSQAAQHIVEQTLRCDAPEEERHRALAKENVVVQINHLRTHPSVAAGLATGKLTLHGWLFELEHGSVLAYDGDTGLFAPMDDDAPPVAVAPRRCRWPRSSKPCAVGFYATFRRPSSFSWWQCPCAWASPSPPACRPSGGC